MTSLCSTRLPKSHRKRKNRRAVASAPPGMEPGDQATLVTARCCGLLRESPEFRMTRNFNPWETHTPRRQLISPHGVRRLVTKRAGLRNHVVLINAVTANADRAHQHAVFK